MLSKPVFELTQLYVRNKCFVSRSMFVVMSLTLRFLKLMEE